MNSNKTYVVDMDAKVEPLPDCFVMTSPSNPRAMLRIEHPDIGTKTVGVESIEIKAGECISVGCRVAIEPASRWQRLLYSVTFGRYGCKSVANNLKIDSAAVISGVSNND